MFLSLDGRATERLQGYEVLVVDAQNFTKEEMDCLKANNGSLYSYLNVGAMEDFREYYRDYARLGLGPYENWEEEIWMDVSCKDWQEFVADKLASELVERGAEGFFLDNLDVYYEYPTQAVYEGIMEILEKLSQWGKPVIVNGGDAFLREYWRREAAPIRKWVEGVNQETLLTSILFSEGKLGRQDEETREYFEEYLRECWEAGLDVYTLEYTDDRDMAREVREYCRRNHIICYISDTVELD